MKVWITRPSAWDVMVRGIDRCELWLQKPFYDAGPRGTERDPLYPNLPAGWRVIDPVYGDISAQVSLSVREAIPGGAFETVTHALWDALCRSVDGMGPDEMGGALKRWMAREDYVPEEEDEKAMSTFLFECEAPPELWFRAALLNGIEHQTAAGRWAQKVFELDTEMGIEPDDPPPVAHPVIAYQGPVVRAATN